ncbi:MULTISPECIES: hypothetical protein [unclassified Variovorax]|uniref:hypothetical protein n=1 Tax=unclassified Variovorax TaxID=663243 RepID=UPI003F46F8AC
MSTVTHEYPRAYEAATSVDPLILAQALDHIARTAAKSRSQTRRTRWIEQRALCALRGDEYRDIDVDLPKSAGPDTAEKLQRRMAWHIAQKHQLLAALVKAEELVARRWGCPDDASSRASTLEEMRAAIANVQEGAAS